MRPLIGLLLLGGLALATGMVAAADTKRYDVEVLVFEIKAPQYEGGELWTRLEEPIDTSEAETTDDRPASELFTQAAEKLRADERFRIVLQKRWEQDAKPRDETKPVLMRTWDNELDGVFRFYQSRFMHVELNLAFQPGTTAIGADAAPTYVIREERRIRSGQLHYFDHPKFGVLVRVAPVQG
jgi:hypothetical protein